MVCILFWQVWKPRDPKLNAKDISKHFWWEERWSITHMVEKWQSEANLLWVRGKVWKNSLKVQEIKKNIFFPKTSWFLQKPSYAASFQLQNQSLANAASFQANCMTSVQACNVGSQLLLFWGMVFSFEPLVRQGWRSPQTTSCWDWKLPWSLEVAHCLLQRCEPS